MKGVEPDVLESRVLFTHMAQRPFGSLADAMRKADQTGTFDDTLFQAGVAESLAAGAFRLVLVLDEAPAELVQLIGYLESISAGVVLDLITVSAYDVGNEQILVPQRVDPEHVEAAGASIWNDGSISVWRSVFVRYAWEHIVPIEQLIGTPMGQGNTVAAPTQTLLDLVTAAYERAAANSSEWERRQLLRQLRPGPEPRLGRRPRARVRRRGGGPWYSKTLRQLQPGNRVYAYHV